MVNPLFEKYWNKILPKLKITSELKEKVEKIRKEKKRKKWNTENLSIDDNFVIKYPGYKSDPCNEYADFVVYYNDKSYEHKEIFQILIDLFKDKPEDCLKFLKEVVYGTSSEIDFSNPIPKEDLIKLIILISLQEEINYPPPKLGLIMPFQKIFEICCALKTGENEELLNLEDSYLNNRKFRDFNDENCKKEWESIKKLLNEIRNKLRKIKQEFC